MGGKFHCRVGFIKIIKAVAVMQRLFCVCLNIVDAQLAGVLGEAQKVFNCCWLTAYWRVGDSPNKYLNRCLWLSSSIMRMRLAFLENRNLIQGFVALATAAKEGLPLTPLWTLPAPPEHHAISFK